MNTPASFELAKLLKEKWFDKRTPLVWLFSLGKTHLREVHLSLELNNSEYNAPTIAEVVMWLYEKYGIWIGVELIDNTREFYFQPTIWTSKDRDYHDEDMIDQAKSICKWKEWRYNSPTEAYEAAIEYTLKNLIN